MPNHIIGAVLLVLEYLTYTYARHLRFLKTQNSADKTAFSTVNSTNAEWWISGNSGMACTSLTTRRPFRS